MSIHFKIYRLIDIHTCFEIQWLAQLSFAAVRTQKLQRLVLSHGLQRALE